MSNSFVRWSGIAAIVVGLASVATTFGLFGGADWLYLVNDIATLIALVGLYFFGRDKTDALWTIGLVVAALAIFLFFISDISIDLSEMIYALGLVILAVAALRADLFSRWVPWMWLGAVVLGMFAFVVPSYGTLLYQLGAVLFAIGFIGIGLALWRSSDLA